MSFSKTRLKKSSGRKVVVPRAQKGASLIEVLIAVLVLAIGLLGIAAMQATALRSSQSAYVRSQGVVNTYSIIDAMRANRGGAKAGSYDMDWTCTAPSTGAGLIAGDKKFWMDTIKSNLGSDACGKIDCVGTFCTVEVRWNDTRAGGVEQQPFSTSVVL